MNRWSSDKLRKSIRVAVCAVGVMAMTFTTLSQDYSTAPPSIMDFADCIDDFGGVTIGEEGVPLAEAPRVTTKTTTKKTTKKEKMKKASKVSKTSRKKKTRTSKKTARNSKETVTTVTTTATTTATSVKKKSKIKTIKTTVKTTIKTTTVPKGGASKTTATQTNTTAAPTTTDISFRSLAKGADERVLTAFESLGFEMTITPTAPYSGVFSARNQKIDVRTPNGSHLLHELGHFVSFIGSSADGTAEFQQIYAAEKGNYKEINASYVLRNSSEYFAESFKNYTEDGAKLKKERPQTYAYVEKVLNGITTASVQQVKNLYAPFWK